MGVIVSMLVVVAMVLPVSFVIALSLMLAVGGCIGCTKAFVGALSSVEPLPSRHRAAHGGFAAHAH